MLAKELLKTQLSQYLSIDNSNKIILCDRAFLGLYMLFKLIRQSSQRSKILFTSNTCASPVYASIYAGFEPIFADISLKDFLMELEDVNRQIEKHASDLAAIVYIYTFGHISEDIFAIKKIATNHQILLIEDVAQALGAEVQQQKAGTIGDFSVFSFGYSKHVDAAAGGAVIMNTSDFSVKDLLNVQKDIYPLLPSAGLLKKYKLEFYSKRTVALDNKGDFTIFKHFTESYKSLYFRPLKVDWEVIQSKLATFIADNSLHNRNSIAQYYFEAIKNRQLQSDVFAPVIKNGYSIYRYSILLENYSRSKALSMYLRSNGIHCSNLYIPVSRFFHSSGFDNSLSFAERVINLWVDSVATEKYIQETIQLIEIFFSEISKSLEDDKN